jgi:hypothetical protein
MLYSIFMTAVKKKISTVGIMHAGGYAMMKRNHARLPLVKRFMQDSCTILINALTFERAV